MDYKEIKNKSSKELNELLAEKRNTLREFKFKANENQLKNVSQINKIKKDIAKILTIISFKKVQAVEPVQETTNEKDNNK